MKKLLLCLVIGFWIHPTDVFANVNAGISPRSNDSNPVEVNLITDVDSVTLGQEYSVGVMFKMATGWHIYWIYPGNTGKPTEVSFQADSSHTQVLEPEFPTPQVFDPKSIEHLSFGYAKTALVLAKAMTHTQPPQGITEIRAQASWLACKETCIPGKANLVIKPPVGKKLQMSKWKELFRRSWAKIPKKTSETGGHLKSLRYQDGKLQLLFALEGFRSIERFVPRWTSDGACRILNFGIDTTDKSQMLARLSLSGLNCLPGVGGIVVGHSKEAKHASSKAFLVTARKAPLQGLQATSTPLDPIEKDSQPIGWMLVLAFLGGLLLNVMPCVIPVVVPKMLHVVRTIREIQDPRQKSRLLWQNSLAYSGGVLATMLALAVVVVVLKFLGHEAGWGFQFQSPWFLVFMISLLLVAGLGMLQIFSIKSGRYTENLKQLKRYRRSRPLLESFFTGLLVTFLGTPCTAPFLGPALGYAFTQSSFEIGFFFLVVGLGLSSPFLMLGVWTGWTRLLPSRVTERYNRIMRIMSFLLFATAVWLLGVLAEGHGMKALMNTLWFLLVLALAAWLYGLWTNERQSPKKRILILTPLLAGVIAFGAWVLEFQQEVRASGSGTLDSPVGIDWQPFSEPGIEKLRALGRTVFIDFTAEWCLNCKVNERLFIETQATKKLIDKLTIAAVKADHTRFDPLIQKWLKRFNRAGVPMYLVFPACKDDQQVILLPEILTQNTLHQALKKAGPSQSSCN